MTDNGRFYPTKNLFIIISHEFDYSMVKIIEKNEKKDFFVNFW